MKISLIDMNNKQTLVFPVSPEELRVQMGPKTLSFSPITIGDIEMPRGMTPVRVSWEGFFPGVRQNVPERHTDLPPNDIVRLLERWMGAEGDDYQLRLIITESSWNIPVFLSSFEPSYRGGFGDIYYAISFTEKRSFSVQEKKPEQASKPPEKRPDPKPQPKTHTVVKGENLWNIARKYAGQGGKWPELWEINKDKSKSKNPDLIYPGEVFTLPAGW